MTAQMVHQVCTLHNNCCSADVSGMLGDSISFVTACGLATRPLPHTHRSAPNGSPHVVGTCGQRRTYKLILDDTSRGIGHAYVCVLLWSMLQLHQQIQEKKVRELNTSAGCSREGTSEISSERTT